MESAFGRCVGRLRNRKKLSLARLAQELGCSAPKLYKIEHGFNKRAVLPHFVQQLSDSLAENDSDIAELFRLAGYTAPPVDDVQRIVRIVEDTLRLPEFEGAAGELVADVQAYVTTWRAMRKARLQNVSKVVIAAAGWQPRLLSPGRFERTLLPAVDEARRAGILDVFLVVPPNIPNLQLLHDTFPETAIMQVVQLEPLGLGSAILAAKEHIGGGPFALMLADEIDESRTALRNLVKVYNDVRKPLVAVDTYEPEDNEAVLRYYGFALRGNQVRQNVFALDAELIEKPRVRPGKDHLRIAGRYILIPEVLHALQNMQHAQQGSVKLDLTAAINQLWRVSASVLAYTLPRPMLSIAPYRQIIQNMDDRKVFDFVSYRGSIKNPGGSSSQIK